MNVLLKCKIGDEEILKFVILGFNNNKKTKQMILNVQQFGIYLLFTHCFKNNLNTFLFVNSLVPK